MSIQITGKHLALPIMFVLLGNWLTLIADISPSQAQSKHGERVLLTQTMIENLPPPPNLPTQEADFNPQQNYQPYQSAQYQYQYQSGQNFQRYFVYVEDNSSQTLQRVRRFEPSAYIRQYNGRSVIQSGVFSKESNALQRVRELESAGIYGGRIAGVGSEQYGNGQYIPNYPDRGRDNVYDSQKSRYYVSIPAKSQDVPIIANQIRVAVGRNNLVTEKRQPLGPHVAIGPFVQRTEAEQWNNYLRNMGFRNARVYYGK